MQGIESCYLGEIIDFERFEVALEFLNIGSVGLELPIKQLPQSRKKIQYYSRITLKETKGVTTKNIKQLLNKHRHNYELIVVEPTSPGLAAICARDGRVDGIKISTFSKLSVFNTRYSRRLDENDKFVEVDISLFFGNTIARNLRPLLRILNTFNQSKINYILTRYPTNVNELRSYRGLQALGRLLDLSNQKTNSKFLSLRIKRNKKKLKGKIPFNGAEIIDGS